MIPSFKFVCRKGILIVLLGAAALPLGQDITILSPNGTTYGHVYPNGDFILQGPSNLRSEGKMNPNESILPSTTYGYQSGDTTIILQPGQGSSFMYQQR